MKKSTNIIAELITDFLDWWHGNGRVTGNGKDIAMFMLICLLFGYAFFDRIAHPIPDYLESGVPEYQP
jgi:hypothetical protein